LARRRSVFFAAVPVPSARQMTINAVFTPSQAEIDAARAVLDAFERAGSGAAVGPDGRFLDRAVVRAAAEVLSRAD
jgi:citrate lyase subunit beta/citryl-CoA lyase